MSDLQVILFVGQPARQPIETLVADFEDEGMLTLLACPHLGAEGSEIQPLLDDSLPDLVCVFADALEQQGEDVLAFCNRLREQQAGQHRPVLVVQTGAPEERRIEYLIQGADDILPAELSSAELKIRLLVHLRRNLDFAANEITRLPGLQLAGKVIQRRLNRQQSLALMLVDLDQFDVYSDVYGELPARQVLKTFAALLSRTVMMPDFICHTDENNFVIATHPDKAEKIATLLCRQFETVAPNFYSEKDRKQGYMVSILSDNVSRRVPLMTLSIGIATNQAQPFDTFMSLFNAAQQMKTLARMSPGNSWQSDRLRLAGSGQADTSPYRPQLLVLETDAALAYLLKTTLEMEGYGVDVVSGIEDARQVLGDKGARQALDLVILDAMVHNEETGLVLAGEIHRDYPEVGIICTSSLHNRQRVLQAGVDLYLPKPFELSSLFAWIHRLLTEGV